MAKTLFEEVADIMNSKYSTATKKKHLKKAGLRDADIHQVFFAWQQGVYTPSLDIMGISFGVEMECVNAPYRVILNKFRENGISATMRATPTTLHHISNWSQTLHSSVVTR